MKVISNPVPVIVNYINQSASTSIIGFARSLLALGLLLTLLFNNINVLIPAHYVATLNQHSMQFRGNFFFLLSPSHLNITRLLAVSVLILIISGYYMQVTSILHCWITASFILTRSAYLGGDSINMLLTLLLIPVCIFDKRKNHWDTYHPENNNFYFIQNLFLFFIKIQVAFIYADSVFLKLHVKEWRDGTVIYYWFNHNFFGLNAPFSNILKSLIERLPFSVSIAWGTLLFEALMSVGFLFPGKVKWVLLKCGIIFHFIILLIHGFALLFFAMSAALFLYLYPAKKSFTLNLFLDEK
jgi:antimicrobial peptide system SdpB family protein